MQAAMRALDNALTGIIVLDGRIAGTWRRIIRKSSVSVEINPVVPFDRDDRRAVQEAAERYAAFLGLALREDT
jgi:hypothetical protein